MNNKNRRLEQTIAECDRVIAAANRLKRALPELERRNRHAAGGDGFSASSMGGGGAQKGTVSNPTAQAALARPTSDPVRGWTKSALRGLQKAADAATQIDSALGLALEGLPADDIRRCEGCERSIAEVSRLVNGECDACRMKRRRTVPR